jgi:hypothetical protein
LAAAAEWGYPPEGRKGEERIRCRRERERRKKAEKVNQGTKEEKT